MKNKTSIFIIIFLVSSMCFAQTYKDYLLDAVDGDAEAQYNLGYCYYYGNGVAKNYQRAVIWWKESAEQDHAPAQYLLGLCYLEEVGVKYNEDSASYWLGLAMANEYPPALYYVGESFYDAGDKSQGMVYISQAAALGYEDAKKFIKDKTGYILTDKDVKSINLADMKLFAEESSKKCPLEIDYMTTLVKVTFKNKEYVQSYIIDEDFIEMQDFKKSTNILKQHMLDDMNNRSKNLPNIRRLYKAMVQNNVTIVCLYKGNVSKEIVVVKITPLEIKRTLKL